MVIFQNKYIYIYPCSELFFQTKEDEPFLNILQNKTFINQLKEQSSAAINMGEQRVSLVRNQAQMQKFVRHLLNDVQALEHMIDNDMFEKNIVRIGAEQEMCLVDSKTFKPVNMAMPALDIMKEWDWVETELAQFNLETNLTPRELKGNCLRMLEKENNDKLAKIRKKLESLDTEVCLTGILPTLRQVHLDLKNLTPKKRYKALMEAINQQLIGNYYELRLLGIDELLVKHDSPLLEACNTSFQVHLQVSPDKFVKMYNIAQAVAAPVMAIASNSPIVFGRRLWHESRIALFQQALDTRTTTDHMRERSPRVNFGSGWLKNSLLEIYKEDIARFRVLLSSDVKEDSIKMLNEGKIPKLRALQVHNSTVYRWNRPCYGISPNGQPHLRIENRVFPAGPSGIDEVANAAFWIGLMVGMENEVDDITKHISYADVRDNFAKSARYAMDSKFTWFKDEKISAKDLILKKLLPIARKGLKAHKINPKDIDKYLGVIEARTKKHMNGARWQLRAYTQLIEQTNRDEALACLTSSIIKNQKKNMPGHEWKLPDLKEDLLDYHPEDIKVEEFMVTDLFTVQQDDIIELVGEMMDWRNIRFTPVEDTKGNLVGLITSRQILRHFIRSKKLKSKNKLVKDIMEKEPLTIHPSDSILDAMHKMRDNFTGCLPVVKGKELVGIVTTMDILRVTGRMLERRK